MPVPDSIDDLSQTAASNSPAGSDAIGTSLDDYLRGIQKILRDETAGAFADLASATTTDLGAQTSRHVRVTGTTTITSFGTASAGIRRFVRFAAALTLTHNGTSLILPSGNNITTAANDVLEAVSLGSGNWIVLFYSRASGEALVASLPVTDATALVKGSSDATKLFRIEVDGFTTGNTRVMTPPDADFTAVGTATTQTLTNKKLTDSTCTFADEGDATKQLAFQCSGISSGNTRTVTAQDASGTMALTSDVALGAWTSYTPTLTAESGTLTTTSASGRYRVQGKTVQWQANITITDKGTATGALYFTFPTGSLVANFIGIGKDIGLTGKMATVQNIDATRFGIQFYDATSPIADGAQIVASGTYEIS